MVSLSDATSAHFVNCAAGDVLSPGGKVLGYHITVALKFSNDFVYILTIPPTLHDAVAELYSGLFDISNEALVAIPPEPIVDDSFLSRFSNGNGATIEARTTALATHITCGELVTLIGQASPLNVVRLERTTADKLTVADRGKVNDDGAPDAAKNDPTAHVGDGIDDLLKKLGLTIGASIAVSLLVLGFLYFKKR